MNSISEFVEYCESLADKVRTVSKIDEITPKEALHEVLNNDQYVIYYETAWRLVGLIRFHDHKLYDLAEEHFFNIKTKSDLDSCMSDMAYSILYIELMQALEEE